MDSQSMMHSIHHANLRAANLKQSANDVNSGADGKSYDHYNSVLNHGEYSEDLNHNSSFLKLNRDMSYLNLNMSLRNLSSQSEDENGENEKHEDTKISRA